MRAVAIVVALAFGYILFGQVGSGGRPPATPRFRLDAKSEMKAGAIRAYAESVYTLYETRGNGKEVERWRVTQQDKYAEHWISPSGTVWVKTDMVPGPGGGGGIWVRDASADIKGHFGVRGDIDVAASKALQLKGGAEQLRLKHPDESETRITVAQTDQGEVSVVRNVKKGGSDLLTAALDEGYGPSNPLLKRIEGTPFVVWRLYGPGEPKYIRQVIDPHYSGRWLEVKSEESMAREATYIEKTKAGLSLWFEFTQHQYPGVAKVDVFDGRGNFVDSADLIKLGEFKTADEAQAAIAYRDLRWYLGGREVPLDTPNYYAATEHQSISFADRLGRQYRLEIDKVGERFTMKSLASMNLGRVQPKEPSFPTARLEAERSVESEDGKFLARFKTFEEKGKTQTQVTLVANFDDPIEGKKSVELFSLAAPDEPDSVKVSNSGRVFAVFFKRQVEIGAQKMDMALFQSWEPNGRQLAFDLLRQKWFANLDQAKRELNLDRMTIAFEGIRGERRVEDVPIPVYRLESLTFDLGGGRKESLYIGYLHDQMPNIFYTRKPKI